MHMAHESVLWREMDLNRPCAARITDAFLGGSMNFGPEQRFVERAERTLPGITANFRESRSFLRRAIDYCLTSGVRQFLDLGSGLPNIGHIHEIARRRTSDFRVLYVDNEPLTAATGRFMLTEEPRAQLIRTDCRDVGTVLDSAEHHAGIDFTRPVAVVMSQVLHFLPERDDTAALVRAYQRAITPESPLIVAACTDHFAPERAARLRGLYADSSDPMTVRRARSIDEFFRDCEPLAQGFGAVSRWYPDPMLAATEPQSLMYGGVVRKTSASSARPSGNGSAGLAPRAVAGPAMHPPQQGRTDHGDRRRRQPGNR